jgi:hypothetical protein
VSNFPDRIAVPVTRQDIADPDKAEAELDFVILGDGDVEVTVKWGNPPRDRGAYLIDAHIASGLFWKLGFRLLEDDIERRCERDPAYRAYMDGDMETYRRLSAERRTE